MPWQQKMSKNESLDRVWLPYDRYNINTLFVAVPVRTSTVNESPILSSEENTEDNEINKEVNMGLLGPQSNCLAIKVIIILCELFGEI